MGSTLAFPGHRAFIRKPSPEAPNRTLAVSDPVMGSESPATRKQFSPAFKAAPGPLGSQLLTLAFWSLGRGGTKSVWLAGFVSKPMETTQ